MEKNLMELAFQEWRDKELSPIEREIVEPFIEKDSHNIIQAYEYLGTPENPRFHIYKFPTGVKPKRIQSGGITRYALECKYLKDYKG